jgi:hypothetical protein
MRIYWADPRFALRIVLVLETGPGRKFHFDRCCGGQKRVAVGEQA